MEVQLEMSTANNVESFLVKAVSQQKREDLLVDEEFSVRMQTPDCGIVLFKLSIGDFEFPCNILKSRHDTLQRELIQSTCVGRLARKAHLQNVLGINI